MKKKSLRQADVTRKLKAIGEEIKRRRMSAKLTQQQLADQADIERRVVALIERGGDTYPIDAFIRCCIVLHATILPVGFDVVIADSRGTRKPFDVV